MFYLYFMCTASSFVNNVNMVGITNSSLAVVDKIMNLKMHLPQTKAKISILLDTKPRYSVGTEAPLAW